MSPGPLPRIEIDGAAAAAKLKPDLDKIVSIIYIYTCMYTKKGNFEFFYEPRNFTSFFYLGFSWNFGDVSGVN